MSVSINDGDVENKVGTWQYLWFPFNQKLDVEFVVQYRKEL